jgi:hypothetical protein
MQAGVQASGRHSACCQRVPPARMMRWRCGSSGLPARVAVTSIAPCSNPTMKRMLGIAGLSAMPMHR